jgi:hypothetical protein
VKKLFGNLLLVALVLAVISFFAAPGVAFFAIRSAADASDVQGLSRLVDFTAVRQSLRPQPTGGAAALTPAPGFLEDPVGAVRRQIEQARPAALIDVDAWLTPTALAALTRGEGRASAQAAASDAGRRSPMPSPVFWGVNRTRLAVKGEDGAPTVFTFERKGPFEWKLVHIGLPDRAAPAASPAGSNAAR